jgi:hypothetical protein
MSEVPTLATFGDGEPHAEVADAHRRHHLLRHRARHARRSTLQRLPRLDRELREIARLCPEPRRFESWIDMPLDVARQTLAIVGTRGMTIVGTAPT